MASCRIASCRLASCRMASPCGAGDATAENTAEVDRAGLDPGARLSGGSNWPVASGEAVVLEILQFELSEVGGSNPGSGWQGRTMTVLPRPGGVRGGWDEQDALSPSELT
jgi:hypothetical protein